MAEPNDSSELARRIQADQESRWRRGERPLIESYLSDIPAVRDDDASVLGLVYSEFHLRDELNDAPAPEEYYERFPELIDELRALFSGPPPGNRTVVPQSTAGRQSAGKSTHICDDAAGSGSGDAASANVEAEMIPGCRFGRYLIERALGTGGMGSVFKAHDTLLDIPVALKAPRPDSFPGPEQRERFLEEARTMARLHHPNLCRIFDYGEVAGQPFIAMGFVDGRQMRHDPQIGPRKGADLVRTVALALEEAHAIGVVHRDLKPANILLNNREEPVVVDFGVAVRCDDDDFRRSSHEIAGTAPYMSPQQLTEKLTALDVRNDVYSLGIVLYELLTGRRPYQADDFLSTARLILDRNLQPPPPSQLSANIDPSLNALCLQAIEKDIDKRFQSMREFASALEEYLCREQTQAKGRIRPIDVELRFLPTGSTISRDPIHEDRLYLDVGNRLGPGVLDHHTGTHVGHSTTSCVVAHPDFVLAAPKPWRAPDSTFTIFVHEHPDLDSIAAAFLATGLLREGKLSLNASRWAAYLDAINQGSCGLSQRNRYSVYAAFLMLSHRLGLRSWSTPDDFWKHLASEGLQTVAHVDRSALTGQSIESIDAFATPGLFSISDRRELDADVERYSRKLADPATAARRVGLRLPATGGGLTDVETLIVRNVQEDGDPDRCVFFKDWARGDKDRSKSGDGFAALCIFGVDHAGSKNNCTISLRPDCGASLRGLAGRLDEVESAARIQKFGVDDRVIDPQSGEAIPPRKGYGNGDPWYDGAAHQYTIVAAPSRGTLLTGDQIEDILLAHGHRERADVKLLS